MPGLRRDAAQSETAWQASILGFASSTGWLWFHDEDSRRNRRGFPDLVLVRRDRVVFAELKSQTGRVRPEQVKWLDRLVQTPAEVYLWRPDDAPEVESILASRHRPPHLRTPWAGPP